MRFDRYTVTLLTLRPDAPVMTDAEAADLQDQVLILARGPLTDQDDESLRGFCIWSIDQDAARAHASTDPAVQAGRLAVQVMTWMMPAGNLLFEKVRVPRSVAEAMSED